MNLEPSLKGEIVCMNDSDWGQIHVAKYIFEKQTLGSTDKEVFPN